MKRIIPTLISSILFFISNVTYSQNKPTYEELKKLRTGNFEYLTGLEKGLTIKRTRHRQYEFDDAIKRKAVLKIKWISDDEYWLIFIKDNEPNSKTPKGFIIKVKILSVSNDTYTCH